MDRESIMLNEVKQPKKDKYHMIYSYVESNEKKPNKQNRNRRIDTENKLTVFRGEGTPRPRQ